MEILLHFRVDKLSSYEVSLCPQIGRFPAFAFLEEENTIVCKPSGFFLEKIIEKLCLNNGEDLSSKKKRSLSFYP